jgi:hypothetical protein
MSPVLERNGCRRNQAFAGQLRKTSGVHEENSGVGSWGDGLGEQRPVHGGVPARLEHEAAAQALTVVSQPRQLLAHRAAGNGWSASDEEPHGLTRHVRVDGRESRAFEP